MGNCWANICRMNKKQKPKEKPQKLVVLKRPAENGIGSRYELGRKVERGEFGSSTYFCKDRNTREELACKSISKNKLKTAMDIEEVRREVEIMRHLPKHPNIVSLKDIYEDDDDVHLVMERCEGVDLLDRIVRRSYTEATAASVIKTIVQVVQMCHKHGVMHRNLKPENILFANNKETVHLKVTDFSLSIFFKPGERFNEIVGSPYYMAPEVLERNYGPEIDIWNAGVILYMLLCGVPQIWAETEHGDAQTFIQWILDFKREPWPKVSDNAKDLVMKMLNPDPKCRLTAQEVLDHPWFQNCKTAMQYFAMNILKKTALRVITDHLSVEEVVGIKEGFHVMDTENNGKINIDELRVGLQKLGHQIPDADVQILMEAGDVDKDRYLDYGEFAAIFIHLRKISHDEHLHRAFQFFDKNESGYIELEELHNALVDEIDENSEEVINAIMHDVDTDKEGKISYEEFAVMMKAGIDWREASRQYLREVYQS